MANDPSEPRPGVSQLGRYHLVSQIATGGMAEIYVARMDGYAGANRLCVIKKIRPRIKTDPRAVQMFLDEARIAATLQHSNIVQMFEVGEMDGNYFIAMEYLHGEDVRTLMKALTRARISLPLDHAVHIAIDVLAGLHYAHEKRSIDGSPLGIVHRDVSPHNIFVNYDGAVKIVDFGIAKATNREHETVVETLKGKIQYMSPEQCRCIELDRRSDIYSVGVVLYELTTGRRLNTGDDEYEVMKRTVEGPLPTPSKDVEDYPAPLESIVRTALAKKPDERFDTALAMQQALENFAHEARVRRSSIDLSRFMHGLFAERIASWQDGVANGTSIRALVEARHELKEDTSGPTFDSNDEPERPSGQLITLPTAQPKDQVRASGPASRRPGPSTIDLYPSIEADEYASSARTAPRIRASGDDHPDAELAPRPARRRVVAVLGLVALATIGAVVGLKMREGDAPSPEPARALEPTAALEIDAGALARTALADAAAPPPIDAAPAAIPRNPVEGGRLRIRSTTGAAVVLDGARRGTSPVTIANIEPGIHTVELTLNDHETLVARVRLLAGKTTTFKTRLKSRPTPAPGDGDFQTSEAEGSLAISSTPAAKIFVDGKAAGFTSWKRPLAARSHVVRLAVPNGPERTLTVKIKPNETTKIVCAVEGDDFLCRVR